MANGPSFHASIGVDGEQKFNAKLTSASRSVKLANSELKALNAQMKANGPTMDSLSAKQEALSKKAEAQRENVATLEQVLQAVKETYGENSEEADRYTLRLNSARAALSDTEGALKQNQQAMDQLAAAENAAADGADEIGDAASSAAGDISDEGDAADDAAKSNDDLNDSMQDGSEKSSLFKNGLLVAAGAAAALAAACIEAAKEGFNLATSAGQWADELLTLSQQTGISTTTLQEWQYAANFIDVDISSMTKGMKRLTKSMGEAALGSTENQEKFDALGVTYRDANGHLRSSEEVFWDVIDALGGIDNETEQAAMAQEIFGSSYQDLMPLIRSGSRQFKNLGKEAHNLGVVMSDEGVTALGSFDDSMQKFKATCSGLSRNIGLVLVPAFQPLIDKATEGISKISEAIAAGASAEEIGAMVAGMTADVAAFVAQEGPKLLAAGQAVLTGIYNGIKSSMPEEWQAVLTQLETTFGEAWTTITGCFGTLTDIITGVLSGRVKPEEAFNQAVSWVETTLGGLWDTMKGCFGTLGGIIENVLGIDAGTLTEPFNQAWETIGSFWSGLWDSIKGAFGTLGSIITGVLTGEMNLTDVFSTAWEGMKTFWSGLWDNITGTFGSLGEILKSKVFGNLAADIENAWNGIKDSVGEAWNSILNFFGVPTEGSSPNVQLDENGRPNGQETGTYNTTVAGMNRARAAMELALGSEVNDLAWMKMGENLDEGLVEGIINGENDIKEAAKAAARAAYEAACEELDINSPSKKMLQIGAYYTEGFAGGIESKADMVMDAARSLASNAASSTASGMRSDGMIDYDRLASAVADANRAAGIGTATLSVGAYQLAEVMEPAVMQQVTWRSGQSITGRTAEIGW